MRLISLSVKQYKVLKDITVQFNEVGEKPNIHFFIGVNGTGKSTMLEALGLIFTRIMQNEVPGFDFYLKYEINGAVVSIEPIVGFWDKEGRKRRMIVKISKDKGQTEFNNIPDEYKPGRIIAYCSGVNTFMDDILISSPKTSLASDLYDIYTGKKEDDKDETPYINELLDYYKNLDTNPRTLYLDAATSRLILPVIFAVLPFNIQDEFAIEKINQYFGLRQEITNRLGNFSPVAFSLVVDDAAFSNMADVPQKNFLSRIMSSGEKRKVCNWDASRQVFNTWVENEIEPFSENVAVFLYNNFSETPSSSYNSKLQDCFEGNPFTLLSTLVTGYQVGAIKEVNFTFKIGACPELLDLAALSDGELMWIARMGLILISQEYCSRNNLFLFDEPDVHFNDSWNKDFISMVNKMGKDTLNEFIIATHSTLILTDAFNKQMHLFDKDIIGAQVKQPYISTFAAQRERIDMEVFDTAAIGVYADSKISDMMQEKDPEKLLDNISKVGPGYHRFRLYERYYELQKEEEE